MKLVRNLLVVFTALVLVGFAKYPLDERIANDLRERKLLAAPIELDTREELGQTSLAIALGGLRSLIASMMNIGTLTNWENQEWYELEQKYKTITTLQPNTRYYWTNAAFHLISNGWADYEDKPDVPEGRRKRIQRQLYKKGRAFLEKGVEQNPEDWRLWYSLGDANDQYWRPKDHPAAAEAFKTAFKLGGSLQAQRRHVYALARIPERKDEAWKYAQVMWDLEHNRRFLSTRSIFFALQAGANPPAAKRLTLAQIYGSNREALIAIPDYWFRQVEGYPVDGLREALTALLTEFNVPRELSPLTHGPDRLFERHPLLGYSFGNPASGTPAPRTWRSVWMDSVRPSFRAYLTYPDRAVLPLSDFWLSQQEGYPLPGIRALIQDLFRQYEIPAGFDPLRLHPGEVLSANPFTDLPFEVDPETGVAPTRMTWQAFWTRYLRKPLQNWLSGPNP